MKFFMSKNVRRNKSVFKICLEITKMNALKQRMIEQDKGKEWSGNGRAT
jgi:hypothetical protein